MAGGGTTDKDTETIAVPRAVWETAFAVFAGHVGTEMALYRAGQAMPEVWANVFRFGCDEEALKRLGVPLHPANSNFAAIQVIGEIR